MKLTKRETEILNLLCEGKGYKEMARATGISAPTLRGAMRVICAKLDAPNRVVAAVNYTRIKTREDEEGLVP